MYKYRYILVLFTLLLSFSTCSIREEERGGPVVTEEKIRFELFTRIGAYGLPVSRAGADETNVDQRPWVLVFRGTNGDAEFVEAVQADELNGKTYVYLTEQTVACRLLILANQSSGFYVGNTLYAFTAENFNTCLENKTLTYASENLLTAALTDPQMTVPYVGQKLPMSDLVDVTKIDASVTIPQVQLKRVVGKIIVRNTDPDFVLEGITTVTNVAKESRLYNLNGTLKQSIGAGNLVEYRVDNLYSSNIANAETIVVGEQTTGNNPLYVYETHTLSNNTYLIIRGRYMNDPFFYKMALVDDHLDMLNLQRNTEYIFTITSVKGMGYGTIADVKASLASNTNLNYTILVQDQAGYEIMSNNEYYLGVTNSHFEIYASAGTSDTYTAFTMITDCKTEFQDKRTITSLTNGLEIVSPANGRIPVSTDSPYEVKIKMLAGFTSGEIELYLGNLRKVITVRRNDMLSGVARVINQFIDNGYYVSAHVEDYASHTWLKLSPGEGGVRNDPDYIYVDDGKINLNVERNGSGKRVGVVYVAVGKGSTQSIKVYITQAVIAS